MTTIACDRHSMAGDSSVSLEGVGSDKFLSRKLHRIRNSVFGESGDNCNEIGIALEWLRAGARIKTRPQLSATAEFLLLELSPEGIFIWNSRLTKDPVLEPFTAVGSGRKVAMYCMKVLKMTPAQAVAEAAKVDDWTKPPIHAMNLKGK